MCRFLSSKKVMRFLKVIVVFLLFIIIVGVPWLDVLANNAPKQGSQNVSDTINNFLTMLGGGGIGMAGNQVIKRKTSLPSEHATSSNTSTDLMRNPLYKKDRRPCTARSTILSFFWGRSIKKLTVKTHFTN